MKVQRYAYGRSNISQLEDKRSNLIKAPEAAAAAAAPYQAVAGAAQNISNDLFRLQQQKNQQQDENDKLMATADMANATTQLQSLTKQAKQERWTQDEFETKANDVIKNFVTGVDKYGEDRKSVV